MDILRFLQDHFIPHWLEGKNIQKGWVAIRCPMSCGDPSNHGGFDLRSQKIYYSCWKCGWHPLSKVIAKLIRSDEAEAKRVIRKYSGKSVLPTIIKESKPLIIPGNNLLPIHRNYLLKRRFNPEEIVKKYQIRGTGGMGKYRFRLVIPIFYGKIKVSFQTRDTTGKSSLAYLTCPPEEELIHHKHIFYNLDSVKDTIIITEGIFDVWRLGDGAVALFGAKYTNKQVSLLHSIKPDRIFIMLDGDSAGRIQSEKLQNILSSLGLETYVIHLPDGKDPGDLTAREVISLRKEIGI